MVEQYVFRSSGSISSKSTSDKSILPNRFLCNAIVGSCNLSIRLLEVNYSTDDLVLNKWEFFYDNLCIEFYHFQ